MMKWIVSKTEILVTIYVLNISTKKLRFTLEGTARDRQLLVSIHPIKDLVFYIDLVI